MERTTQAIAIIYNGTMLSDYGLDALGQVVAKYSDIDPGLVKIISYDYHEIADILIKNAVDNTDMKSIEDDAITNAIQIVVKFAKQHIEYSPSMTALTKRVMLSTGSQEDHSIMNAILVIAKLDKSDIKMAYRKLGLTNGLIDCCKNHANLYHI